MALATICDRCGEVYKVTKTYSYVIFDPQKIDNPQYNRMYNGIALGEPLDLCESCQRSLKLWVEQKEGAE